MTSSLNSDDFANMIKAAMTERATKQPDLMTQSEMLEAFDLTLAT